MRRKLNIPVTMDPEFAAEIDRVAKTVGITRSQAMRWAIRIGLPKVARLQQALCAAEDKILKQQAAR